MIGRSMEENTNMADNKPNNTDGLTEEQKAKALELKEQAKELGFDLVDAKALDAVLQQIEKQNKTIEELSDKVDETADKSRLELFDRRKRGKGKLERYIRLNVRDVEADDGKGGKKTVAKVVVGWKMIVDKVEKNPNSGVWTETQIVEIIYEDDSKEQITYMDFATKTRFVNAMIIKREKDEPFIDDTVEDADGNPLLVESPGAEVLTVRTDSGKEYKIDASFVN